MRDEPILIPHLKNSYFTEQIALGDENAWITR